mmetsp:Transcript_72691/g.199398  ORF Transcript_72691/g.199398 Transcript_72691/m.199398 type:complete len:233 (-) Transcript_72691:1658-2356(-)
MSARPLRSICSRAPASGRGMSSRFCSRRRAASSSSCGRLVAPTTRRRSSAVAAPAPSICTSTSFLTRIVPSCSPSRRCERSESTSSMKMTAGCLARATAKRARTIFSPSPIHLLMSDEAEIEKKVDDESVAIALAISVLPVPGGPKSSRPLGGVRAPLKMSGRFSGSTVISRTLCLAKSRPAMASQPTPGERSTISVRICSTSFASTPRSASCSMSSATASMSPSAPPPPPT